jgi:hypothetical protein
MWPWPIERWAQRNPSVRYPLVLLLVFAICVLGSLSPP